VVSTPIDVRQRQLTADNGFFRPFSMRVMSIEDVILDDRGADQYGSYQDRDVREYLSSLKKILIHF